MKTGEEPRLGPSYPNLSYTDLGDGYNITLDLQKTRGSKVVGGTEEFKFRIHGCHFRDTEMHVKGSTINNFNQSKSNLADGDRAKWGLICATTA